MFSQSFFATILFLSAVLAADPPADSSTPAADSATKSLSAANVPQCATLCMSTKINEAATWYGKGDLATYCTHPNFLVAYNTCLQDHCHGGDIALGQQAGATACGSNISALTAPLPPATVSNNGSAAASNSSATPLPTGSTTNATSSVNASSPTNVSLADNGTLTSSSASHSGNTTTSPIGPNVNNTSTTSTTTTNRSSASVIPTNSSSRFGTNSSSNNTAAGSAANPASIVTINFSLLSASFALLIASLFF